ncbi:T9SS type A sorting domain-containing protein [Ulvibacter litoralis]|nr:T9SS type A sorting domain-containing protein [Ulvibacter litoralis]
MTKFNITKSLIILACLFGVTNAEAQFTQEAKVVSENRERRGEYGTSVAITDGLAIVGASRETFASGAAYVYSKDSQGAWNFTQELAATDSNEGAEYGGGVKISEDYLVVAAGRADVDGVIRAGALYVYDNINDNWELDTKIVASDLTNDAKLGMNPTSLAIQGNTIIAGAPGENGWIGSVYIFTEVAGVWEETQKITNPASQQDAAFGIGVSISGDYLLIGAQNVDQRKGAAYIYVKNSSGMFEYEQTITASDRLDENFFGSSVSISGDQLIVGAYGADSEQGSAYVFEKDNQGTWTETQKLNGNPSTEATHFGWVTEIHEEHLVIAAPHIYGFEAGEVYFYKKDNNGLWVEDQIVQGDDTEGEDFYGWSVAMYENEMIVGAAREDHDVTGNNEESDAGSAYIFKDPSILGGITNGHPSEAFSVYPVPAKEYITITTSSSLISEIKLINELGMIIKETSIVASKEHQLDVSGVAQGIYFLDIVGNDGAKSTKKIVKID